MTKSLAKELGPRNIRVNSVNPGFTETEGVHDLGFVESSDANQLLAKTPLGRMGQPSDIAPSVAFLASDEGAWITGENIRVSAGLN